MIAAFALHLALGVVACLYAAVGHAGASGYTAVLTIAGYDADVVRPTALILNVLVATLGTIQFYRGGHFALERFLPYALLSVPGAFIGGRIHVSTEVFRLLIGVVLLLSAARFLARPKD